MKLNLILISPIIFSLLAIILWAAFRRTGWTRRASKLVFTTAASAVLLYALGFIASLIGDHQYKGSGEPFDWGPHYVVTTPMMFIGIFLAPFSALLTLVLGVKNLIKRRSEQGGPGYPPQGVGSPDP